MDLCRTKGTRGSMNSHGPMDTCPPIYLCFCIGLVVSKDLVWSNQKCFTWFHILLLQRNFEWLRKILESCLSLLYNRFDRKNINAIKEMLPRVLQGYYQRFVELWDISKGGLSDGFWRFQRVWRIFVRFTLPRITEELRRFPSVSTRPTTCSPILKHVWGTFCNPRS